MCLPCPFNPNLSIRSTVLPCILAGTMGRCSQYTYHHTRTEFHLVWDCWNLKPWFPPLRWHWTIHALLLAPLCYTTELCWCSNVWAFPPTFGRTLGLLFSAIFGKSSKFDFCQIWPLEASNWGQNTTMGGGIILPARQGPFWKKQVWTFFRSFELCQGVMAKMIKHMCSSLRTGSHDSHLDLICKLRGARFVIFQFWYF